MATKIGHFEYEIDENKTIRVWNLDNPNDDVPGNPPFMLQPTYPDNTEFESVEAAKVWIEEIIGKLLNPPAPVEETPAE